MPVRYKLAAWSSLLILFLFVGYSLVQYQLVYHRMMESEKESLRKTAGEIIGFFAERDSPPGEGEWSDRIFEPFVRQDEMLRLLDRGGKPIYVLSRGIPAEWLPVQTVEKEKMNDFYRGQDHLLWIRSPIHTASFQGTLELAANLESLDTVKEQLYGLILICGVAGVAISAVGGLFLARQLVRPVQRLTETMNKVKKEGLHERVHYKDNGDELSRLAVMFNGMMDELERSFLAQRRLIEDASHEFRTPIAIIEGHLTMLERWGKREPGILDESLHAAIQETERLKSLANQMLELTRTEMQTATKSIRTVRLAELVQALIRNYELLHPDFGFQSEIDPAAAVQIDPHHLEQILIIATDNAVRYSEPGRLIFFRIKVRKTEAIVEIEDQGSGIPEEDLPFVFDRFYRVEKARSRAGGGSGLGLSIAKRLVEAYKGTITLRSRSGVGTVVSISFPQAPVTPNCDV